MSNILNDGTLVRGSITTVISGVTYRWTDFSDDGGAFTTEEDFDENGKPLAANSAEGFRRLTGTIRVRSDQAAPPKGVIFTYDGESFYILNRTLTGSTTSLKEYQCEAMISISGSVTIS